jgi:putative transposase
MRAFTGGHRDWLTVIQLPAYAPDLNPVKGAWSVMKNGLGNLARHHRPARRRRPALITGFLGQTGLGLGSQPP